MAQFVLSTQNARRMKAHTRVVILKGKDGLRYLGLVTSNAYGDRDGEIVAESALKKWVNSVWKGGAYRAKNPLLFWHAGQPIGDVIWSDMRGAFLIEIAKERRTKFAKLMFDLIERSKLTWGVSHGFYDKAHDFDGRWKVYHRIAKKETSVLPLAFAANPFTSVRIKSMNLLRMRWLKKNAPEAAEIERELSREAKQRQRKLDGAGVTRKSKGGKTLTLKEVNAQIREIERVTGVPLPRATQQKMRQAVKQREQAVEKAIDPAALADSLTTFLDGVFADAGVDAPEDLSDRIGALIESLDDGDAPLDAEVVAETIAEASEELLAEEGAEAPDDLQEQIAEVIDEEVAAEDDGEEVASRKHRTSRKRASEPTTSKQTQLLEDLLDDLSVLDEIAEEVKALKPLRGLARDMATVKKEMRLLQRKMAGGPRAASDDEDTELEDDDDADDEDVREFKQQIKRQKNKGRSAEMFADLYDTDDADE